MLETKKGYKKTKLGWIPEDWKNCKFSDIPDQKIKWSLTGGPFGSDLKSSDYTDESGVRIIQLQNIGDGSFLNSYKIFTSEEKADQLIGCNIYPGELILSKMGDPVTRTCIIPDFHDRYLMASDGIRLVPDKTKFDKKFVLEFINFELFRNIAIAHSTGSTRQRIGLGDLKKLPFVCPPLPEQQKIATILSTWDKAIDKLTQLIAAKEQRKKGLMQLLLTGKKRLFRQGSTTERFKDEWKEVKLGTLTSINMGQSPDSKSYNENGVGLPLIQGNADLKNRKSSPRIWTSEPTKISEIGDLILTVRAPVGSVAKSFHNACIGRGVCSIKATKCDIEFIYQVLIFFEPRWQRLEQGSTFSAVSSKDIKGLKLKLPNSIQEQQKIASVLSTADKEIELLRKELEQLQQQKKGLMQVLLTGALRVPTV